MLLLLNAKPKRTVRSIYYYYAPLTFQRSSKGGRGEEGKSQEIRSLGCGCSQLSIIIYHRMSSMFFTIFWCGAASQWTYYSGLLTSFFIKHGSLRFIAQPFIE
jgi:hypothetical protein